MRLSPDAPEQERDRQRWLSLGVACRILGVNESTLRRWSDAGQIRSFRTPGGHRRFSEADIRSLMAGRHSSSAGGRYDELGSVALTRIRRQLQRGRGHDAAWYLMVDPDARERMRPLGRRLVTLVTQYVGRRSGRHLLLEEAHHIGFEYGQELASSSLSLRQAIEALTFFRKNLDEAAKQVGQRRSNINPDEVAELREQIVNLADHVLLGLTEAYEQHYQPELDQTPRMGPAKET